MKRRTARITGRPGQTVEFQGELMEVVGCEWSSEGPSATVYLHAPETENRDGPMGFVIPGPNPKGMKP